jgi:hypothetical protein
VVSISAVVFCHKRFVVYGLRVAQRSESRVERISLRRTRRMRRSFALIIYPRVLFFLSVSAPRSPQRATKERLSLHFCDACDACDANTGETCRKPFRTLDLRGPEIEAEPGQTATQCDANASVSEHRQAIFLIIPAGVENITDSSGDSGVHKWWRDSRPNRMHHHLKRIFDCTNSITSWNQM